MGGSSGLGSAGHAFTARPPRRLTSSRALGGGEGMAPGSRDRIGQDSHFTRTALMGKRSGLSRRDVIRSATAAAMVAGAGVARAADGPGTGAPAAAEWFDRPMRWFQLVLAENDPGEYDARFWVD